MTYQKAYQQTVARLGGWSKTADQEVLLRIRVFEFLQMEKDKITSRGKRTTYKPSTFK